MRDMYTDDELLPLSGVQHYAFCPRQWALIQVEQQWEENARTISGEEMHERCHDQSLRERRGNLLVVRGLRVVSHELGLYGVCDVVEFRKSSGGVPLSGESGLWAPLPVEYKNGSTKIGDEDRLQLCAQANSLEEMFCCKLSEGYLFYGATRSRERVSLSESLRKATREACKRMHDDFERGISPKPHLRKSCNACSLKDRCLPALSKTKSISEYMDSMMEA
ncbi:CRISPR-associated protein Cas4 [Olsenella sp. AM30-3LB]|jgi:CRISPR-associated exonuclease Cas4|uniref:CRISPR-associated protein Cas4 n=2 Tax=unclassified Olsenella TaxID=2638792 RepID=UPI000E488D52|nr:CRISPR-associated protein Cas4 [Olsenella sp. AM30-3LB]RHK04952.1 CRISPR-associated protein Cas4 [Olsenella sp. AM04-33]